MKFITVLFLMMSLSCHAEMYLKLRGETIVGHSYKMQGAYATEINDTILVDLAGKYTGVYKYKFVNNKLVALTDAEKEQHPAHVERLLTKEMAKEEQRILMKNRIDKGGVNSNILHLIKRLRPGVSISLDKKVHGDGKSLYERIRMANKPTFQELSAELNNYKNERKQEVDTF